MASNVRYTPTHTAHFNSSPAFENEDQEPTVIHVQSPTQHSTTMTKVVELVPCRICEVQTKSDELGSPHENCKKEICKICLPTLEQCPSCNGDVRRAPVLEPQGVLVVPVQRQRQNRMQAREQDDALIPRGEGFKCCILVVLLIYGIVLINIFG